MPIKKWSIINGLNILTPYNPKGWRNMKKIRLNEKNNNVNTLYKKSFLYRGVVHIPFLLVILVLILPLPVIASDINVWYGEAQNFGEIGLAQKWVNILGHVSEPESLQSFTVTYPVAGVPTVFNLSVGPDDRRLNDAGDFNVEIDFTDLALGPNNVLIEARDQSNIITSTVTVNKYNNIWPIPYSIDWSPVDLKIQDVAQIVDGYWTIDTDGVRSIQPGYDRIIAIGDKYWTDYEITVPIKINYVDPEAFDRDIYPVSAGAGIGILLRWQGHVDADGTKPTWGWWESGCDSWYEYIKNDQGEIQETLSGCGEIDPFGRTLEIGKLYVWKMRVQTIAGEGSLYSFKLWEEATENEPLEWQMTGLVDLTSMYYLESGSLLLIAHHVDGTFGDVDVIPIEISNVPVISNVDVNISSNKTEATITWNTNVDTTGEVQYGLTDAYGLSEPDNTSGTNHSVTLTNLLPDNPYYYLITATSANGGFVSEYIPQRFGNQYNLRMSVSPNRSGAVPLSGQIVSGNIYVFTGPDTGVKRVSFSLDGVPHSVENYAPFDFEGTGVGNVALPFDTTQLDE